MTTLTATVYPTIEGLATATLIRKGKQVKITIGENQITTEGDLHINDLKFLITKLVTSLSLCTDEPYEVVEFRY